MTNEKPDIKKLVFGNGRYADLVKNTIEVFGKSTIDGYLVDKEYFDRNRKDVRQFCPEELENFSSQVYIGFTFQNRKGPAFLVQTAERLAALSVTCPGFDYSTPSSLVKRGVGVQIFNNVVFDIGSHVGDFSQVRPNVTVGHDVTIGSYTYIAPSAAIGSCTFIKSRCFIGFGATIAPNTVIEEGCVIGAGSFVQGVIKQNSLVTREKPRGIHVRNPFRFL